MAGVTFPGSMLVYRSMYPGSGSIFVVPPEPTLLASTGQPRRSLLPSSQNLHLLLPLLPDPRLTFSSGFLGIVDFPDYWLLLFVPDERAQGVCGRALRCVAPVHEFAVHLAARGHLGHFRYLF